MKIVREENCYARRVKNSATFTGTGLCDVNVNQRTKAWLVKGVRTRVSNVEQSYIFFHGRKVVL